MFYTYILRSISQPEQRYIGSTADLKSRLAKHNAGEVPHTSKFKPWKIETAIAFSSKEKPMRLKHILKHTAADHSLTVIFDFQRFTHLQCQSLNFQQSYKFPDKSSQIITWVDFECRDYIKNPYLTVVNARKWQYVTFKHGSER